MRSNRPNNRASTEVQALLAAMGIMATVVAFAAVKQFFDGLFYTDPAASTEQVTNVANGIGNAVSAAPGLAVAVLVLVTIGVRALK